MTEKYNLAFDATPEFVELVDAVRGEMPRDAFLHHCIERGLGILFKESRPDLLPRGVFAKPDGNKK